MKDLRPLECPVWRILPADLIDDPASPARAPEGRFHHSDQIAAYASLSLEGALVAVRRHLVDGVARIQVPMFLRCARVADIRKEAIASAVWQDFRKDDSPPPTWTLSDAARAEGAQAMQYASRTRPDLTHIVVFEPDCLSLVGPITPFEG